MNDDHRRAHERHDLPGHVPGEVKIYHSMEIRQFSEGGALIESASPSSSTPSTTSGSRSANDRWWSRRGRPLAHQHRRFRPPHLPHRHRVRRSVRAGAAGNRGVHRGARPPTAREAVAAARQTHPVHDNGRSAGPAVGSGVPRLSAGRRRRAAAALLAQRSRASKTSAGTGNATATVRLRRPAAGSRPPP